jgi:hypothetical protein
MNTLSMQALPLVVGESYNQSICLVVVKGELTKHERFYHMEAAAAKAAVTSKATVCAS